MSDYTFSEVLNSLEMQAARQILQTATAQDVEQVLQKIRNGSDLRPADWAVLVSAASSGSLEILAQAAREKSLSHFGKSVVLYTPMYLSNYCINGCKYCSYGQEHSISRKVLSETEMAMEAKIIAETGLRNVLLLTGESDRHFNFEDICQSVKVISPYFDAVSIESYALSEEEYHRLEALGVIGVTLYQETYSRGRYEFLHPFGPKADYDFRLGTPERVGASGLRQLNLGVLMGLSNWREDVLDLMAHGAFIQRKYPAMELSFSLPRMIAFDGSDFEALGIDSISDRDFLQAICALRLALPQFSINLSTRETKEMRQALLPIGINKMSAGVSTEVGGRLNPTDKGDGQFAISDHSSVAAVREMILESGCQPIMRDFIKF